MSSTDVLECVEIETGPNPAHAVIWLHGLGADGNDFAQLVPELKLNDITAIRFVFPHAPTRPVTIHNGMNIRPRYDIFAPHRRRRQHEPAPPASPQARPTLIPR